MRVHLKGVNISRKRLADGTVKTFYYLGKGKGAPKLDGEPGSPEFMASYERAMKVVQPARVGVLQSVITAYMASSEFAGLARRTQDDYAKKIMLIERKFGDLPIAALTDPRVRGEFKAWRDQLATKSLRQADYSWTVLARVLAWGEDRGLVPANPCKAGGRLYKGGGRRDCVWTEDDEIAFLRTASPELTLALQLALWTGQRQGDLLRLTWTQYDGATIRLTQSKTGQRIAIPVGAPLRLLLDRTQPRAVQILTNTRGIPWNEHGFRSSWRKAAAKAGVTGLTFHDLRGTAVSRLALAGASVPEIATFTGHSLADVRTILDSYYFHRDPALAREALQKLEARTIPSNRPSNRPVEITSTGGKTAT